MGEWRPGKGKFGGGRRRSGGRRRARATKGAGHGAGLRTGMPGGDGMLAEKAEREARDLKGTMRKRMEFLDFD